LNTSSSERYVSLKPGVSIRMKLVPFSNVE
jgi:hypothetical protein